LVYISNFSLSVPEADQLVINADDIMQQFMEIWILGLHVSLCYSFIAYI